MKEQSAKDLYSHLENDRMYFTDRAEDSASITIPTLFPKDTHFRNGNIDTPWSGTGAKAVNSLSSRLLLTLFPPSSQFVRLILSEEGLRIVKEAFQDSDTETKIEAALFKIEKILQTAIETRGYRPVISEILKHLIVTGNALAYFPDKEKEKFSFYPVSQYVVERDAEDNILTVIIKEGISNHVLKSKLNIELPKNKPANSSSDLYTYIRFEDGKYKVHQEVEGLIVPGSEGSYKKEDLPYIPLRWNQVKGEAYGRGYVDEYIGSFKTIEGLTKAIVEGAVASARILPMVNPNGVTDPAAINNAENLEAIEGVASDITFLQVNKVADMSIAAAQLDKETKTVEQAFLLTAGNIRNADRVTAEEIRLLQQELTVSLGGAFSVLSQEFQLPLVNRLLRNIIKLGEAPEIPKEIEPHLSTTIVTGIGSLGRTEDLQRVSTALGVLQTTIGPQILAQYTNIESLIDYVFTSSGVSIKGLIKTSQQIEQERQAALQQQAALITLQQGAKSGVQASIDAQKENQ